MENDPIFDRELEQLARDALVELTIRVRAAWREEPPCCFHDEHGRARCDSCGQPAGCDCYDTVCAVWAHGAIADDDISVDPDKGIPTIDCDDSTLTPCACHAEDLDSGWRGFNREYLEHAQRDIIDYIAWLRELSPADDSDLSHVVMVVHT